MTPHNALALQPAACNLPAEHLAADYTVLPSVRAHVVQTHCALTFQSSSRAGHGERGDSIPATSENTLHDLRRQ